jgi:hypothetical protein
MLHDPTGKSAQGVRQSASAFGAAFRATLGSLLNLDDESGKRIVPGYVSIVVKRVPVDAILLSSLAALRASAHSPLLPSTFKAWINEQFSAGQPSHRNQQPLPAPARAQPRRLVPLG